MNWLDEIRFDENGLVPAIAQDAVSGKILMMAWMNRESLRLTAEKKEAVYWSRSRGKLWHKGEESGHTQKVVDIRFDCDEDVILLSVEHQGGIACHTGRESCFYRQLQVDKWVVVVQVIKDPAEIYSDILWRADRVHRQVNSMGENEILTRLSEILEQRKGAAPDTSYVASLYAKGLDAILKKVGEEATETVMAAKDGDPEKLVYEVADLWFHTMVLLADQGLSADEVLSELGRRFGVSGHDEKASRT